MKRNVIIIYKVINLQLVISALAPTHLFVNRVGPCYDTPKTIVTISEMTLHRMIYDFSLHGELNITENINNGWHLKATMQKCQDMRNLDTCDYFKSYSIVKNGCVMDGDLDNLDLYTMFFHYSHPRLSCPIMAGNYKVMGYPFFTEDNYLIVSEAKISTSVFGYTFRLEGFSEDKRVLCVDASLQLLYIRDHDWIGNEDAAEEVTTTNDT